MIATCIVCNNYWQHGSTEGVKVKAGEHRGLNVSYIKYYENGQKLFIFFLLSW